MNRKPFTKLPHNARVEKFLADNGLPGVKAKWLPDGSLKHRFMLFLKFNPRMDVRWTEEHSEKMNALGFRDFDGRPLTGRSGNGGVFSLCVVPPLGLDPRNASEVA